MWRLDQLEKHTADPNHPYNKFGTGKLKLLRIDWHVEDNVGYFCVHKCGGNSLYYFGLVHKY